MFENKTVLRKIILIEIIADFEIGTGPMWIDDINCTGYEVKFSECRHSPWGQTKCSKDQSVGCVCSPHQGDHLLVINFNAEVNNLTLFCESITSV